jgi:cytochrome c553
MKRLILISIAALLVASDAAVADQAMEDKVAVCAGCHGDNGLPKIPEAPIIWGQEAGYIYLQLKDFKSKNRASEIMNPIAEQMSKEDMLSYAEYFSAKKWPSTGYNGDPAEAPKGEQIATSATCPACHNANYLGNSAIPRVAGQTQPYLERQILAFKSHARANNPGMSDIIQNFSDDDLKLMTRYLAGLY